MFNTYTFITVITAFNCPPSPTTHPTPLYVPLVVAVNKYYTKENNCIIQF